MEGPFIRTSIVEPVTDLLMRGVTPEKVALSLALGFVVGMFPVVGSTTLMCMVMAFALRLNMAAALLANWIAYPVQIILLAPFFIAGAHLFGTAPIPHDSSAMIQLFRSDFILALRTLGSAVWQAILVWGIASPVIAGILFFSLVPAFNRFMKHSG